MKEKITINLDEDRDWGATFGAIPGWDPQRLKEAKVMVVGAGALGNEVVKNLTLLNIGHLFIVDFDIVEYSNLAKSVLFTKNDTGAKKAEVLARNLKLINDSVKTQTVVGDISTDIGIGVFRRMDVVIGCLDNRLARLYINRHCHKVNKSWIDGAIENLSGRYSVYTPNISCFECSLTDAAWEIISFRMGCPDVAKRNASMGVISTTPISSSIIGAFQVQEALKIIFGHTDGSMAGEGFRYNGTNNFFMKYKESELKQECDSHYAYEPIIEAKDLSHNNTVAQLLDWLENHFSTKNIKILVEEDIVLEAAVSSSEKAIQTAIYKNHLAEADEVEQLEREAEDELYVIKSTNFIDRSFPYPDKPLAHMGIPFLEILKIEANNGIHFVELTGDENKLQFK